MYKVPNIYGTTLSGTEDILSKWLDGDREKAISTLIMYITINRPETLCNTRIAAEDTIKAWLEKYFD